MSGERTRGHAFPSGPRTAVFATAYAGAILASYLVLEPTRTIASVWPAGGIALGALLVCERRLWVRLVSLLFVVGLACDLVSGKTIGASVAFTALSLGEALLGAWIITRWCGPGVTLARVGEVLVLVVVAAVLPSLFGGIASLGIGRGGPLDGGSILRFWWIGHGLSFLVVAPAAVSWTRRPRWSGDWGWMRALEAAVILGAGAIVAWMSFSPTGMTMPRFPSPYWAMIAIVWAAIRFGFLGAVTTMAVVTACVVAAIAQGPEITAFGDHAARFSSAQLFMAVLVTTGLLLAAGIAEKETALSVVRDSESRFRAIFEASANAVCVLRRRRLTQANQAFLELFGYPGVDAVFGNLLVNFVSREDCGRLEGELSGLERNSSVPRSFEMKGLRADGSTLQMSVSFARFLVDGELYLLANCRDLTEQLRAEREVRHVNRALRAVTACSETLVRATSEPELLSEICRVMAASKGYRLAWVGMAEQDEGKAVRPVAYAGFEAGYLEKASITWADAPNGQGPAGRAIRSGEPRVCQDVATNPEYAPWRADAIARGYNSSIGLPLRSGGKVFGVVSLYSAETDAFDPEEIRLLQDMADSVAYGIFALRAREQHSIAEREVHRLLAEAEKTRQELLFVLADEKRAVEAKDVSEARYRGAMENSAIGMGLISMERRWIEVNPALCKITGYTRAEMLQRTVHSITHPDDRGNDQRIREDFLEGVATDFEIEKRYVHKSGRTIWVHVNGSLVHDSAGKPLHLVSQVQDVTARKQAEDSLAAAAERLALALRASKFGVWRHNLQTRATEWDARMFAIFGLREGLSAPSNEEILKLVAEEDRDGVRRSWSAMPSCDHTYHTRFRVVHPDGQTRHIELQGIVHDDKAGRPEWSIGVAGDITEIIQATTDAERLRAQLQQSQKMEALGQLAAGVAHDFNNLLTGINGFVELASTSLDPDHEATDLLRQAKRGAKSARDLVRRILSFSRGKADRAREPMDLVEVVRDTAPLIAAALPATVSLSVKVECEAAVIVGDSGQLQQILMNLCTNGAQAIGPSPGEIQIMVQLRGPRDGNGTGLREVRLSVRDTGVGMDKGTLDRIFEPFYTTKRVGEGTGLGLSIVRDIVASHEGRLEVDSAPGTGTTFVIWFPLARDKPEAAREPRTAIARSGSGQRVMVVDDEAPVASVIRLMLQRSGYDPTVFHSPAAAWEQFASGKPGFDLLIVDKEMPEISGTDFIRKARAIAPGLPVILVSGRFESEDGEAIREWKRVATLKKPFEIDDLLATVRESLDASARPSETVRGG